MKKYTILLLSILFINGLSAQNIKKQKSNGQTQNSLINVDDVDIEAEFIGGQAALQAFIIENIKYPIKALEKNEQGKVYIAFVVNQDGSISDIEINRSPSKHLSKEAIRLVKLMPNWSPGMVNDKAARTRVRLPINFTLSED